MKCYLVSKILILAIISSLLVSNLVFAEFLGETEVIISISSTKTALSKSSSSAAIGLQRRLARLQRAQKSRKRTKTLNTPTIKQFLPESPVDFADLTPNSKGFYIFNIKGTNFSKDMTLLATNKTTGRRVSLPFKYLANTRIEIKSASAFEATIAFTLLKSAHHIVLESNTLAVNFLDSSSQYEPEEPTPSPTASPTPATEEGTATPTPASPTVTPTPTNTATPPPSPIISSQGDHVATIETEANAANKFVLRAVIPIPAGKIRGSQINLGQSFLAIEDSDGNLVPAQIEYVTKNAGTSLNDSDPDISEVEVIAQVNSKPGQARPQYRIFEADNQQPKRPNTAYSVRSILSAPPFLSDSNILGLFSAPGRIIIKALDIFGNVYSADLTEQLEGNPTIFKYGSAHIQVRSFNVLKPEIVKNGPTGTYPRLFSVHSYFSMDKESKALKIELKIGNTLSGLNNTSNDDDYLKEFYYQALWLEVAAPDWDIKHLFPSAYYGAAFNYSGKTFMPLVMPMPGNVPHYMPALKHILLRSAIFPKNTQASIDADILVQSKGLGFSVKGTSANNSSLELFSYFNSTLASYLPQGSSIPTLTHVSGGLAAVRSDYQNSLNKFNNLLAQEKCSAVWKVTNNQGAYVCDYPLVCGLNPQDPNDPNDHLCGPVSALGVGYGGMTGGTETSKMEGAMVASAASLEGYRWLLLQHKLRTQRNDQFHKRSGEVVYLSDLEKPSNCGIITPIDYFDKLNTSQIDPFGVNQSPTFMSSYVSANNLKPDYEHFWNPALSSSYKNEDGQHSVRLQKNNDALVWLSNDSIAKDSTLAAAGIAMFQHPFRPVKCNGTSAVYDLEDVYGMAPSTPGTGTEIGREEAHMWSTLVSAYAIAPHSLRTYIRPAYFDYVTEKVFAEAQIPSLGYISRSNNFGKNSPNGKCWTVMVNEEGFLQLTAISMRRRVYQGADQTKADLLKNIVTGQVYANLIPQLTWADGSGNNNPAWHKTRYRPAIAAETTPNIIFTAWNDVPLACQNDSNTNGGSYGEYLLGFSQVRQWTNDPYISQAFSEHVNFNSSAALVSKLQGLNLATLEAGIHLSMLACAQQGKC